MMPSRVADSRKAIGYPNFPIIAPLWDWDAKTKPKEVDDDGVVLSSAG
jgi:hypothetical protein